MGKENQMEIRVNHRRGRAFDQVILPKEVTAVAAAEAFADFHDVAPEKVLEVTGDVAQYMQEGPYFTSVWPDEVQEKTSFQAIFVNRYKDAGISDDHARRMLKTIATELAGNANEETAVFDISAYRRRRVKLLNSLERTTRENDFTY